MSKCLRCKDIFRIQFCTVDSGGRHHSFNDQPAVVFYPPDGTTSLSEAKEWFDRGDLHRIDGPALEWSDNEHEWFYKSRQIHFQIKNQEIIIGKPVEIEDDVATVLRHVEGVFWEVLLGCKKVLIAKV